jgi:hypothetical protein
MEVAWEIGLFTYHGPFDGLYSKYLQSHWSPHRQYVILLRNVIMTENTDHARILPESTFAVIKHMDKWLAITVLKILS